MDGCLSADPDPAPDPEAILAKLMGIRGEPPGTSASLTTWELRWLCDCVEPILRSQPSLLLLAVPIVICGDTHGQYPDLLRIFDGGGPPPATSYLFLGDYVDRGCQSIETIALLFLYKVLYPDRVFLLRGNHECSFINRVYGFYDEIARFHPLGLWHRFCAVFQCLPFAAVVAEKIFCVHGGLSPHLSAMPSIDALGAIERPCEVPETGLLCDLVWADPDPGGRGWGENERGTSVTFDLECVAQFCEKFGFDLICRAHQAVMDGYEFPFSPDQRLVTLFSAPNYCYEYDNKGAFLVVDAGLMCTFKLLEPTPGQHPLDAEGGRSGTPPRGGAGQEHV